MYNFFNKFENLLIEAKADVYDKLKNNNVRYKKNLEKNGKNYFDLMGSLQDEGITEEYKKLVLDYIDTNTKKQNFEEAAMYVRGFCDCVELMSEFGCVISDDLAKNIMNKL